MEDVKVRKNFSHIPQQQFGRAMNLLKAHRIMTFTKFIEVDNLFPASVVIGSQQGTSVPRTDSEMGKNAAIGSIEEWAVRDPSGNQ